MSGLFRRLSSRRSAGPEGTEPHTAAEPGTADAPATTPADESGHRSLLTDPAASDRVTSGQDPATGDVPTESACRAGGLDPATGAGQPGDPGTAGPSDATQVLPGGLVSGDPLPRRPVLDVRGRPRPAAAPSPRRGLVPSPGASPHRRPRALRSPAPAPTPAQPGLAGDPASRAARPRRRPGAARAARPRRRPGAPRQPGLAGDPVHPVQPGLAGDPVHPVQPGLAGDPVHPVQPGAVPGAAAYPAQPAPRRIPPNPAQRPTRPSLSTARCPPRIRAASSSPARTPACSRPSLRSSRSPTCPRALTPTSSPPRPATSARRGKLRRRVAFLRAAREVLLRDLGGFMYEVHRTAHDVEAEAHRRLRETKLVRLARVDAELHEIEMRLDDVRRQVLVREPGVGGECPHAASSSAAAAHYCSQLRPPADRGRARSDLAARTAAPPEPSGADPVIAPTPEVAPRAPTSPPRRSPRSTPISRRWAPSSSGRAASRGRPATRRRAAMRRRPPRRGRRCAAHRRCRRPRRGRCDVG